MRRVWASGSGKSRIMLLFISNIKQSNKNHLNFFFFFEYIIWIIFYSPHHTTSPYISLRTSNIPSMSH
jgi:hypothetical protein